MEGWVLRELALTKGRGAGPQEKAGNQVWPWGREKRRAPRELTRCRELAGRRSKVVEAIEKQLGFQGLVWPQPGARQGSLRLPFKDPSAGFHLRHLYTGKDVEKLE